MAVPVAAIMKGIQIAGQVKDVADTVNTVAKAANVNQDSVFAKNEEEGKGGAINSIFQAADTITGGTVGKIYGAVDEKTGGVASKAVHVADQIATPVIETADALDGPDVGDVAKVGKKLPNLEA
ncbi:hypothetical protein IJG14_08015 [bacterium]|nr:hypothetical protein [bacterium]